MSQFPRSKEFIKKMSTKYRCNICNKKVKTLSVAVAGICKCKKFFCYKHRFPEYHNCTFDYQSKPREELKKNMPVIVADKVPNRI